MSVNATARLVAKLNRDGAETLLKNVVAMPAEKLVWKPLDEGRTVLDQIQECAVITGMFAVAFKDRKFPEDSSQYYSDGLKSIDTIEKAVELLKSNADSLATGIESFSEADLEQKLQFPWDDSPKTFAELAMMNYWNLCFHEGQIAYIQTLYGDRVHH